MTTLLKRMGLAAGAAWLAVSLQTGSASALDSAGTPVVVTPLVSTDVGANGKPLALPQKNAQIVASIFDIATGATLPVHKHPYSRYGYVLAGTLQVTSSESGKSQTYKTGDFIVEMIDEWHQGSNIGAVPVKLLVIDLVEKGASNTVLRD